MSVRSLQFVSPVNLPEEGPDDRIFGKGGKGARIKDPEPMRLVTVLGPHLAALDNKLGWKGVSIAFKKMILDMAVVTY